MIDIDAAFEKYLRNFIAENAGKITEEQLEDKVSELYEKFGKTPLKELDGLSPKDYFKKKETKTLVDMLGESVKKGASPSDFLCEEIEAREDADEYLISLFEENRGEELSAYCVNLLTIRGKGDKGLLNKYISVLKGEKAGESLTETIVEVLKDNADKVKDEVISLYEGGDERLKDYSAEILSASSKDDRVFAILGDYFKNRQGDLSQAVAYLSKYGDDRALDLFYEAIKKKDISYLDYKELKLAIEEFGGEVADEKDFTFDSTYIKLKGSGKDSGKAN